MDLSALNNLIVKRLLRKRIKMILSKLANIKGIWIKLDSHKHSYYLAFRIMSELA